MEGYEWLESKFRLLLDGFDYTLSESEKNEILFFLNAGEYGVGFETFCSILADKKITFPADLFAIITELAERMNTDIEWWESLQAS